MGERKQIRENGPPRTGRRSGAAAMEGEALYSMPSGYRIYRPPPGRQGLHGVHRARAEELGGVRPGLGRIFRFFLTRRGLGVGSKQGIGIERRVIRSSKRPSASFLRHGPADTSGGYTSR